MAQDMPTKVGLLLVYGRNFGQMPFSASVARVWRYINLIITITITTTTNDWVGGTNRN